MKSNPVTIETQSRWSSALSENLCLYSGNSNGPPPADGLAVALAAAPLAAALAHKERMQTVQSMRRCMLFMIEMNFLYLKK